MNTKTLVGIFVSLLLLFGVCVGQVQVEVGSNGEYRVSPQQESVVTRSHVEKKVVAVKDGRQVGELEHHYVFPVLTACLWLVGVFGMAVFVAQIRRWVKSKNYHALATLTAAVAAWATSLATWAILIVTLTAALATSDVWVDMVTLVAALATLAALAAFVATERRRKRWAYFLAIVYFVLMSSYAYLFYTM